MNLVFFLLVYFFSAACARAGEWSHALRLFIDMKTDRIRTDVVAYNALASAFMIGGKPDMVRSSNRYTVFIEMIILSVHSS